MRSNRAGGYPGNASEGSKDLVAMTLWWKQKRNFTVVLCYHKHTIHAQYEQQECFWGKYSVDTSG